MTSVLVGVRTDSVRVSVFVRTDRRAGFVAEAAVTSVRDDLDHVTTRTDLIGCGHLNQKVHHRRSVGKQKAETDQQRYTTGINDATAMERHGRQRRGKERQRTPSGPLQTSLWLPH